MQKNKIQFWSQYVFTQIHLYLPFDCPSFGDALRARKHWKPKWRHNYNDAHCKISQIYNTASTKERKPESAVRHARNTHAPPTNVRLEVPEHPPNVACLSAKLHIYNDIFGPPPQHTRFALRTMEIPGSLSSLATQAVFFHGSVFGAIPARGRAFCRTPSVTAPCPKPVGFLLESSCKIKVSCTAQHKAPCSCKAIRQSI